MQRIVTTLLAASLASLATAQTVVIPAICAAAEGASSTAYPWGRGIGQIRVQYVYDSTHFTSQSINSPIIINQLRWRANGAAVTAGYTYGNTTVQMSAAAVDYLAPSTTFANNHGPSLATVYAGPATVNTPSGTTPNDWYVTLPIAPFFYDPSSGADLCVDTLHDGIGAPSTAGPANDCATTNSLTSRIFNLTNAQSPTGTTQQNVGVTLELSYVPAAGLFANFAANVTGGASPLAVQFTDTSYSSAPGGVVAWAWDFNGDTVVDSTLQNPNHVYTNCGTYTVSLTVNDGVNPPSTITRTNYVTTDQIVANFTSQVIGPLTVQFTDTSNMPATSWAWDLNGDNIVDSNAQSPVFVYPNSSAVNVTLTATRLCSTASVVTKSVVPTQQLSTNLTTNNGVGATATLYFNLNVLNPLGISVSSFDTICQNLNTAYTADVYLKLGTYQGSELVAAPWTLVGTASGTTGAVANQPSNAVLASPLYIPQGSYGVAIRYVGPYPRYVTQTALTTWGNGDVSLTAGAASLSTSGAFTGTNLNSPRSWAGTLYYGTNNVTNLAGYGWFGPGCNGTLGRTHVTNTTQPTLGGTLTTNLDNLQFGIAVMVIGLSNTLSGGAIPLPLDLGLLGAPGCPLRVSLDVTDAVIGAGSTASWSFNIPNQLNLMGFKLYNQAATLDSINAFGFAMSDAYGWVLGN